MSSGSALLSARLLRHGGTYVVGRLVERAIALALLPVYAYYLGAAGYGVVAVLGALMAPLAMLFSQGLLGAWLRLRFDHHGEDRRRFETTVLWYLLCSCCALLALVIAFGAPLAAWLAPGVPLHPLFWLACTSAAAGVFSDLYLRRAQAEQRPRTHLVFSLLRSLSIHAVALPLVVLGELGALGRIAGECAVALLFAAVAIAMLRPASPLRMHAATLRQSLAYGLPLLPHALIGQLHHAASRLVVVHVLGLAAAGVFSVGFAIASFGTAAAIALNQAYQPLFFGSLKRAGAGGPPEAGLRELHRVAGAGLTLLCAVALIGLALAAAARELIALLAPSEFSDAWVVVAPLAGAAVAQACTAVSSQSVLFTATGTRRIVWVTALAAAVHVTGSLLLLPALGILGAGLALLAANGLQAALVGVLGHRLTPVPHRWACWSGVLAATACGLAALYAVDVHVQDVGLRLAGKLAVLASSGSLVLLAAGLPPRSWMRALRAGHPAIGRAG